MAVNFISINPFLLFFIGMTILYVSSEIIINHSILISKKYNISKLLVGVFIVAFGTSLPELFVSIIAVLKDNSSIVLGNIIGSNITNIGLVFGVSIILSTIKNNLNKNLIYNITCLFLSSLLFVLFLSNGDLIMYEGIILVFFCFIYLFFLITKFKDLGDDINKKNNGINIFNSIMMLIFGFFLIYIGSKFFVDGALGISKSLGVNHLAVGMTIVSLGTSAPELFTTIIAIKNKESSLAIGNIIGSNIFNVLLVGGISTILKNIKIDYSIISFNCIFLILITLLFIISILIFKKINRLMGVLFIIIYLFFIVINF